MPPGPTSSNRPLARAAPNCTEAIASTGRAGDGRHAPRDNARMAVTDVAPAPARERSYEELEADLRRRRRAVRASWTSTRSGRTRARCSAAPPGAPIRVASKSVRCRPLLDSILDLDPGFRGLMTFTLPRDASGCTGTASTTCSLAYPSADRAALAELARLDAEAPADRDGRLRRAARLHRGGGRRGAGPIRVCIDLDIGLVAARRTAQGRRQALAGAHSPAAGARAGATRSRGVPASSCRP